MPEIDVTDTEPVSKGPLISVKIGMWHLRHSDEGHLQFPSAGIYVTHGTERSYAARNVEQERQPTMRNCTAAQQRFREGGRSPRTLLHREDEERRRVRTTCEWKKMRKR